MGVRELVLPSTVTLLFADIEDSAALWETRTEEMDGALKRLDEAVSNAIAAHGGVHPIQQRESDSFVVAFGRASEAVAAALDLQRAPLAPIRLRIGIHTGEVRPRAEGHPYAGPTVNRTARLRDLAHGGQTVLSSAAEGLVADHLPDGAWLTELGTHRLRDLPHPERVAQLCHPDLPSEFPPLRTTDDVVTQGFPVHLTRFVGRAKQIDEVHRLVAGNRLVTLTGSGGVGKTRMAAQVAAQIAGEFGGAWFVDLAPITDPALLPGIVARALGVHDRPGHSMVDTVLRALGGRRALVVLDNCEHLLDATAALVTDLVESCPGVRLMATSREPIRVPGEVSYRVPSLSLSGEAIELFSFRAQLVRPEFRLTDDVDVVTQICERLDGMPLAIELAAARVRAMSPAEIVEGLRDRFQLLTGGARTVSVRQQTLWASVDWSHALLSESERVLFRRLAVFVGYFFFDDARAVVAGTDARRYQVLDELTLLVEKSLVVTIDSGGRTRYRLAETIRQYALEKLEEAGELNAMRARHRDHYTALVALLDDHGHVEYAQRLDRAEVDIDNLRAAYVWSRENSDADKALALASSLLPVWMTRGRIREGRDWLDTALAMLDTRHVEVAGAVRARALAAKALLDIFVDAATGMDQALQGLAIAREVDHPAVLSQALTACGLTAVAVGRAEAAAPYFTEAIEFARAADDRWRLSEILTFQAIGLVVAGSPVAAREAAEEGHQLANSIGDQSGSLWCRWCLGYAQLLRGDLADAVAQFSEVVQEAGEAEVLHRANSLQGLAYALAYQGDVTAARAAADAALESAELGEYFAGMGYSALATVALAAGDVETAQDASEAAWQNLSSALPQSASAQRAFNAQVALASGHLSGARCWCDDAVQSMTGRHLAVALTTRARIAIAEGKREDAERYAHDALACLAGSGAYVDIPDVLECLAELGSDAGSHQEAARLFGAAEAARQHLGVVRFVIYQAGYEESVTRLRDAMGEKDFDSDWAEGSSLSIQEAIAYAQRGRGWRKRPATGWLSLTPTEIDVVRLVGKGLANKDIATRLFVSPRTVQTHLTHVYTKLGITSRVQLAQAAASLT
jgi:predicted ATPase/class 3 adenylate cyclase/DNA-binding CsgD family transcriptional regulator